MNATTAVEAGRPGLAGLLAGYDPNGSHDEMLAADGSLRPHYRPLVEALAAMTPGERAQRFSTARQYLREAGVFYRIYGADGAPEEERGWPLAFPPLIIARAEWAALEAGLKQRATFLERLLGDLYGRRSLIEAGVLPPAILGRNPEFLRPLADQGLSGEPLIRFVAVDLGRGPDGRWWVLGDRTQAPSGAGFALENRVAAARAFPEANAALKVQRLAGFFARFREALFALNGQEGGRIGVLTPGPHNETYFEHAYLARYLGFLLLEGGDLAVRDNVVSVRTVGGLRPLKVLWRRLDSDFADPLELYGGSRIGTPGLVRAARAGTVRLVNALGSGLLETRALLAFQPALAAALLGETLKLPTIATWWGGQAAERDYVAGHRETLSLADAFPANAYAPPTRGPLDLGITREAPDRLLAGLAGRGEALVGQERVRLSTAPVFSGERLVPRPVTLRVFLARDADGWHVMPGGFARIADAADPQAVSMQSGGHSTDVWIGAERAEEQPVTLLGARGDTKSGFVRRLPGALPARAADNLFWLGRYAERAEVATRLLRIHAARQAEGARADRLERRLGALLTTLGVDAARPAAGLKRLAGSAFDTASRIRDRFSPDGWRTLREIVAMLEEAVAAGGAGGAAKDTIQLTSEVLTRLSGFAGLVGENMYQFTGWRFLTSGRVVERGLMTAAVASRLAGRETIDGALEALLDFADSRVTYRRRYSVALSRETALDLVTLDPLNPRSIAYQVNAFVAACEALPGLRPGESLDMLSRRAARLKVRVATAGAAEVTQAFLDRIASDFSDLSDLLSQRTLGTGADDRERTEHE